jgi:hypothetical protein
MGSLKKIYDHDAAIERFEDFLRGLDSKNSSKKQNKTKRYREKGGINFIRDATELLSSALDNVEADLHPEDANQRIIDSCNSLIMMMVENETVEEDDIIPIYQMFFNMVADCYQGFKSQGKYSKLLKELSVEFEVSAKEEENKVGGKLK